MRGVTVGKEINQLDGGFSWAATVLCMPGRVSVGTISDCVFMIKCFHVYQDWSTTQRTSSQFDNTVGSIGVNMGQHRCGMLLTPSRVQGTNKLRQF